MTYSIRSYLTYKAQIVCVCVCVCVCVFAFGGHVFCLFATKIGTHTRHAQGKVCVKIFKKLCTRSSFEGSTSPRVKFLDDASATHSSSFEHTPTPVLCRLYASSSFAKLLAIEYLLPMKLTLLALSFLFKFRLHLHRIQPTHFLQQALHSECVDFYRNKPEEKDSNSFSTSGTSQQRLYVTCPQTYLYTTVLPVQRTGHGP